MKIKHVYYAGRTTMHNSGVNAQGCLYLYTQLGWDCYVWISFNNNNGQLT